MVQIVSKQQFSAQLELAEWSSCSRRGGRDTTNPRSWHGAGCPGVNPGQCSLMHLADTELVHTGMGACGCERLCMYTCPLCVCVYPRMRVYACTCMLYTCVCVLVPRSLCIHGHMYLRLNLGQGLWSS